MHLPFLHRRYISLEKVSLYLLNENHPDGAAKARFFKAFGFTVDDAAGLVSALSEHPVLNDVERSGIGVFGVKYFVRCQIETPDGRNPCICSIWIVEADQRPRLVTAYPA